jgi:hypothetical protein
MPTNAAERDDRLDFCAMTYGRWMAEKDAAETYGAPAAIYVRLDNDAAMNDAMFEREGFHIEEITDAYMQFEAGLIAQREGRQAGCADRGAAYAIARRHARRVDDEKLKALWPSRLPDKLLAERMGHSRGTIRRRAKALGLPIRRALWGKE